MNGPEFYVDAAGEHRWRVKAANGEVVADSAEGYRDKRDAAHGFSVTFLTMAEAVLPHHVVRFVRAWASSYEPE